MSIEAKLAKGMGYEYCVLFSRARVAIAFYVFHQFGNEPFFIPSNVCPALAQAAGPQVRYVPVDATTGLAIPTGDVAVQLYGYRLPAFSAFEIDPMMTGWRQKKKSDSSVIS